MKKCCSEEVSRGEMPLYGAIRQCRECGETFVFRRKGGWVADGARKGGDWRETAELVLRDGKRLTEWERDFVSDILEKVSGGAVLSKKQAAVLRDISAKRLEVAS